MAAQKSQFGFGSEATRPARLSSIYWVGGSAVELGYNGHGCVAFRTHFAIRLFKIYLNIVIYVGCRMEISIPRDLIYPSFTVWV